jgi:ATP-dependent Lon protease
MLQSEISDGDTDEVEKLVQKVKEKHFSKAIQEKLDEEFARMRLMQPASPEYAVSRNYIDWFLAIPYGVYTDTDLDLKKVKKNLDSKHFGLDKVKERILEYVAVLKQTKAENKAPIICLVGPPGVGKTTLVRSIAESLGRNFARVTLGGVQDEAEIRGHRRTYIGSMPGRFVQALRHAKCMNPVILLDEIDKMGNDYRGDPASAMLEVLDPELNPEFVDHFMEVGLDFSKVLFIATANSEATIPAPLEDRMEVVRLPGYYPHEKLSIAKDYLVPKALKNCGVENKDSIVFDDDSIKTILREYTREAGVRELERMVETIVRKRVKETLMGKSGKLSLTPKLVEKYLGVPRFLSNRLPQPGHFGVITGLAWTSVGGEILLIETKLLSGRGNLLLTGKLGDVMKESAQIALSLVRERLLRFDIDPAIVRKTDIHIHVPEGAVPKDGPSAGIALTLSLLSAFTKTPVAPDIAFTGEVSLSGDLLPIGGLNEKALAAVDAGVKTLYLPKQNEKDIVELPATAKKGLKIHTKEHIDDLISILFPKAKKKAVRAKKEKNG